MLENSQHTCIRGIQRLHQRAKSYMCSTQTLPQERLEASSLLAILSVWPCYPQATPRSLSTGDPWPAKCRFLNVFQAQRERDRERKREGSKESVSLLALRQETRSSGQPALSF